MKFLIDNLGRDKVSFARDGFTERTETSQRVSMRSPIGTTQSACRRCLGGGGREGVGHSGRVLLRIWSACSRHQPVVRAVSRSKVEGGVGVDQCRGEKIRRSQDSARDEPRNFHLSVHRRGDCVVSTRALAHPAQQVAWSAPVSREPFWQAAQGTGSRGPAQPRRRRTESTYSWLHHGAVMWVQAPHPRTVDLSVPKFLQSRRVHPRRAPCHASGAGLYARSCPRKR